MILEKKQLLDHLLRDGLLQINTDNHQRTWEYYFEQYNIAFHVLLEIAKQKLYQINCKFMPFLFLMRHSLELYLKLKISNTATPWEQYGKTHNLLQLCNLAGIDKNVFLKSFECLKCNSEGDCWRYILDKKGNPYFDTEKEIYAFDACNYYCLFLNKDDSLTKDGIEKSLQNELTFHTNDCYTLGHIGTQYDLAIQDILLAIQSKQVSINDVYLPLLFLLRHCLEIKLKDAILELGDVVNSKDRNKSLKTHYVKKLYKTLTDYISDDVINSITDPILKEQSKELFHVTKQYKDEIASLDTNSCLFRFPKDGKNNDTNFVPQSDCVSEILSLYWRSDPFLCFAVPVLFMEGVLNIGDDKAREYYE